MSTECTTAQPRHRLVISDYPAPRREHQELHHTTFFIPAPVLLPTPHRHLLVKIV
jgi:hypothetical protein